jgi:spore germination cell wall hydrolase CwlJ-like protein
MRRIAMVVIAVCCLMVLAVSVHAESEIVYQTIAMEAAGESDEGQAMVASVILNRAKKSKKTLEAVCLQPKQFSCWNSRKWAQAWLSLHYDAQARYRAVKALETARNANLGHATHYHTTNIKPYWSKGHKPSVVVGRHAFYEGID